MNQETNIEGSIKDFRPIHGRLYQFASKSVLPYVEVNDKPIPGRGLSLTFGDGLLELNTCFMFLPGVGSRQSCPDHYIAFKVLHKEKICWLIVKYRAKMERGFAGPRPVAASRWFRFAGEPTNWNLQLGSGFLPASDFLYTDWVARADKEAAIQACKDFGMPKQIRFVWKRGPNGPSEHLSFLDYLMNEVWDGRSIPPTYTHEFTRSYEHDDECSHLAKEVADAIRFMETWQTKYRKGVAATPNQANGRF